jgi:hypothetical protein
VLSEFGVNIND